MGAGQDQDWIKEDNQYVNRRPSNLEKYNQGSSLINQDEVFENHRPSAGVSLMKVSSSRKLESVNELGGLQSSSHNASLQHIPNILTTQLKRPTEVVQPAASKYPTNPM